MTQVMTSLQPSFLGRLSWPQSSIFREYLTRNDGEALLPLLRVEDRGLKDHRGKQGKEQQQQRTMLAGGRMQGAGSSTGDEKEQVRELEAEPQRVVQEWDLGRAVPDWMTVQESVAQSGVSDDPVAPASVSRCSSGSSGASDTDFDLSGRSGEVGDRSPTSNVGEERWNAAERQRQEDFILARLHSLLPTEVLGGSSRVADMAGPDERQGHGSEECAHSKDLEPALRFCGSIRAVMTVFLGFVASYIFVLLLTAPHSWNAGTEIVPPRLDLWALVTRILGPVQCWVYARSCPLLGFLAMFVCIAVGAWVYDGQRWKRKAPASKPCVHCEGQKQSRSMIDEADERALKAQKAKQQFMAYVFHNIRVPFNAIVLGLGHMRAIGNGEGQVGGDSDRIDLLQMMLDCAETMTGVLDDVTDMGQWEDGRIELTNDEFDLLAVIKFLSWGLKDLLDQKQIRFQMQIDALARNYLAQHRVVADKHRVVQTLGNFLSNAMKFTPPGGRVDLNVTCLEVLEEQDWAVSAAALALLDEPPASPSLDESKLQLLIRETETSTPVKSSKLKNFQFPETSAKYQVARLQISVKDTGIGISVADQAKLFEPYSFVSSGWVQKAGVSGLGLSMAKRFVEQVGGQIGVDSTEGEGSTFYFSIPFPLIPVCQQAVEDNGVISTGISCEGSDIPNLVAPKHFSGFHDEARFKENLKAFKGRTSKSTSSSQALGAGSSSRKRRVLLVEDTAINRIVLRKVLENLNLLVEEAENGKIAVDMAQQGRKYDLILMDKEMPVMDGHQATRQLRTMGVKTPIIALTGNSLQSDRELFFQAGVDDFQTKPLSRDKLVQLLARYGVESSCA